MLDTIEKEQKELAALEKNFASAKIEAEKPFEREQELQEKLKRSFELDTILKAEEAKIPDEGEMEVITAKEPPPQPEEDEPEYGVAR